MKTIQAIQIWKNGQENEATILSAYVINDNLKTGASFYFQLLSETQSQLSEGNLYIDGVAYDDYETNDYAYNWIAEKLGLTITGDYVPPVVENQGE